MNEVQIKNIGTKTNTLKSFNSMLGVAVNVKHFGAKGDGVTDDTANIQAAITAAELTGAAVFLPAGDYLLTNTLILHNGTKLYGEGYNSALYSDPIMDTVDDQSPNLCPYVSVDFGHHNTEISNIRLVGRSDSVNVYGWHGRANSYNNIVTNCWFENFGCTVGGAVDPSNSYKNIISNNVFTDNYVAIYLTGTNNQYGNIVSNNQISSGTIGIKCEFSYNTVISNNTINVSDTGIYFQGSYNSIGGISVSGNSIVAASYGIFLYSGDVTYGFCRNFSISGNTIKMSAVTGIAVYGTGTATDYNGDHTVIGNTITGGASNYSVSLSYCQRWVISDNIIRGSSESSGILLSTSTKYCTINGNDINAYFCININNGGQVSNIIKSNYFSGNTGIAISASAALALNTIIESNVFSDNLNIYVTDSGSATIYKGNITYTGRTSGFSKSVTATSDGLTTGQLTTAFQDIFVTSANANNIICLPVAVGSTQGAKINGSVGENGFELRVHPTQAGNVYLNGVTTNVEAAIPANSSFQILCLDETHWIVKAWSALGTQIAIVPDAV